MEKATDAILAKLKQVKSTIANNAKAVRISEEKEEKRREKIEADFKKLTKETIEPVLKNLAARAKSSGFESEYKREDAFSVYLNIKGNKPYFDLAVGFCISKNMTHLERWIDMEDEYYDWIGVENKKISKKITTEDLLKEISSAVDNVLSQLKQTKE